MTFALACFIATALLGARVARRLPGRLDRAFERVQGTATPLAAFFTLLGRWYALAAIALAVTAAALAAGRSATFVVALFASEVVAQGIVSFVKGIARRPRPERWLLHLEHDSSYPSGHAVTSVVFFAGLGIAAHAWIPHGPLEVAAIAVLVACVAGIPWSRLALGAHYLSDVAGGLLFGAGWLSLTVAVFSRAGLLTAR